MTSYSINVLRQNRDGRPNKATVFPFPFVTTYVSSTRLLAVRTSL